MSDHEKRISFLEARIEDLERRYADLLGQLDGVPGNVVSELLDRLSQGYVWQLVMKSKKTAAGQ